MAITNEWSAADLGDVGTAAPREKRRSVANSYSDSVIAGRFHKLEAIGSGGFGVVYRARDRRTGEIVAVKCLRDIANYLALAREIGALEACSGHPSIVQPRASGTRDDGAATGEAFLVMEFVGPTLRHVMKHNRRGRRHTELEVRLLMRQLLAGATGMHRRGLMHRDLKPENVLVDARGNLKICDLGLSCSMADAPPYSNPVGTRWYRAPELLLGSTDYDALIDLWALGCMMAELLAGKHPFRGSSDKEQLSEVLDVLGTEDIKKWSGFDGRRLPGAPPGTFLRNLFPCPAEAKITGRPALSEAGFEVLSGLLRCNPDKRLTARRALQHRWFKEANPAASRS